MIFSFPFLENSGPNKRESLTRISGENQKKEDKIYYTTLGSLDRSSHYKPSSLMCVPLLWFISTVGPCMTCYCKLGMISIH